MARTQYLGLDKEYIAVKMIPDKWTRSYVVIGNVLFVSVRTSLTSLCQIYITLRSMVWKWYWYQNKIMYFYVGHTNKSLLSMYSSTHSYTLQPVNKKMLWFERLLEEAMLQRLSNLLKKKEQEWNKNFTKRCTRETAYCSIINCCWRHSRF